MQQTFLEVVEENQAIIYKICKLYRDRKEDQEDLFQEIVFQLWKAWPRFRRDSKPSTWMCRIALNTALAVFRKSGVDLRFQERIHENLHPPEHEERSENEERMYDALKKLTPAERAIISLFLEDYSHKEIGDIIGITENYVGVQMSRIKSKLRAILN